MKSPLLVALCCAALTVTAAQRSRTAQTPDHLEASRAEVYKEIGQTKLLVHIFEPGAGPKTNRPAIVFFFGGGWVGGSPAQFQNQCRHFASRGMVAMAADYRVGSRHGVKPVTCVEDAKSCIRWIRENARRLGIDPQRVVAAGGSAGGHLAAATATLEDINDPADSKKFSAVPNALVLFNPALVLAPLQGMDAGGFGARVGKERLGTDPVALSPGHHIKAGTPPAIIFHGKADETVPYATAEAFAAEMKKAGNRCELMGFEGQGHGFFNYGRNGDRYYKQTLDAADKFLVSIGFLPRPELAK